MTKDANDLAKEFEIRERRMRDTRSPRKPRGTLSIWESFSEMHEGRNPYQASHVIVDLDKPGLVLAYDENGDVEIYVLKPGWFINFVPDRNEGE